MESNHMSLDPILYNNVNEIKNSIKDEIKIVSLPTGISPNNKWQIINGERTISSFLTWKYTKPIPYGFRSYASTLKINSTADIYMIGGYDSEGELTSNSIIYNINTNGYRNVNGITIEPIVYHAMTKLSSFDEILIAGGQIGKFNYTDKCRIYNYATFNNRLVQNLPYKMRENNLLTINSTSTVINSGGRLESGYLTNQIYRLNEDGTWTDNLFDLPFALAGHKLYETSNNTLLLIGGYFEIPTEHSTNINYTGKRYYSPNTEMYEYNINLNQWSLVNYTPFPFENATFFKTSTEIIVVDTLNMYRYSITDNKWIELAEYSFWLKGMFGEPLNDNQLLISGGGNTNYIKDPDTGNYYYTTFSESNHSMIYDKTKQLYQVRRTY